MDALRRYLWLWVLGGALLAALLLCCIFILINRCISRTGKQKISQLQSRSHFQAESNKYEARAPDTPPLPPRSQFLAAETQSYENLAEVPGDQQPDAVNVENPEEEHDYEEAADDGQDRNDPPDYVKVEEEEEEDLRPAAPLYQQPHRHSGTPGGASAQSYENLAEEHDYEEAADDWQDRDDPPDYVKVEEEEEEEELPPPPATEAECNSSEDYDDIGGEDDDDYDDVG
ncbi:nucleolin [Salarias fasciatus]|uniref:nucleolin n=1 Tax=Salarias fasciatus TaxID=181472 RepID=UPI001176D688|nr:nucleolin-like [Salarias fasciatus]